MRKGGRGFPIWILLAVLLCAAGCGAAGAKARTGTGANAVEETLQRQAAVASGAASEKSAEAADEGEKPEAGSAGAAAAEDAAAAEKPDAVGEPETEKTAAVEKESADSDAPEQPAAGDVDYDLTAMGSDMVYATVFKLMQDPLSYEGKTFRMEGQYYSSYYEPTGQNYHFCIIADALGCCKQGMEFIWGDGTHVYPDEYPPLDSEVIVTGTFETYQEEGDESLYCHIANAELERVPAEAGSQQGK
ncbi:hypothetical protein [Lachnoclostridium sp. Marseille-P6806]|uniref:hypothetical protein n=1 Tax=Lachnoclostridium sp. Marseille-P6806 TaxID=2364793 RepID=UPI00102FDF22|nr:hypothetical protein [Lachnoclostridium sp. Marseille-P6806]